MSILERLLNVVAPHNCLGCGDEGSLLCSWCRPSAISPLPSRCFTCHKLTPDAAVCANCRKQAPLKHVWVTTEYEELSKLLVKRLKYERTSAAADVIAELMSQSIPFLEGYVVSHVPTATSRQRQRGYDHAELIARSLAKRLGLPRLTLLARTGQSRQVGASRQKRLQQLSTAFRPVASSDRTRRKILLVDDIVTTGATIQEAAKALKATGAKHIDAAVFAQKV